MKKVLVIQKKMIGDVLLSSILIEFLKNKEPNCRVDYLVNSNTLAVITGNPYIDKIIEITPALEKSKLKYFQFLLEIRKAKYDLVIDAYGTLSSNIITFFSGAQQKVSWYKKYTNLLYTKTIKPKPVIYTNAGKALEDRLRLVLNEDKISENIIRPKIFLSTKEKETTKINLKDWGIDFNKKIIMVSVLGSGVSKTYPHQYMAQVLDSVVRVNKNAQILFNYIPSQKQDVLDILNLTATQTQKNINISIYGKSLREFLNILNYCDVLIGNEGGAVNMAKALNIPTFTIFSPWINKNSWNMFDDGKKHVSVHLKDYKESFYTSVAHPKELKKDYESLYNEFKPQYFLDQLTHFLNFNLK